MCGNVKMPFACTNGYVFKFASKLSMVYLSQPSPTAITISQREMKRPNCCLYQVKLCSYLDIVSQLPKQNHGGFHRYVAKVLSN